MGPESGLRPAEKAKGGFWPESWWWSKELESRTVHPDRCSVGQMFCRADQNAGSGLVRRQMDVRGGLAWLHSTAKP